MIQKIPKRARRAREKAEEIVFNSSQRYKSAEGEGIVIGKSIAIVKQKIASLERIYKYEVISWRELWVPEQNNNKNSEEQGKDSVMPHDAANRFLCGIHADIKALKGDFEKLKNETLATLYFNVFLFYCLNVAILVKV